MYVSLYAYHVFVFVFVCVRVSEGVTCRGEYGGHKTKTHILHWPTILLTCALVFIEDGKLKHGSIKPTWSRTGNQILNKKG